MHRKYSMKIPDEQRPTVIKLPNGTTYPIDELLAQTYKAYTESRVSYNLGKRTKANKPKKLKVPPKRVGAKYTKEDAQWIRGKTADEVADKYNITRHQAYHIKNYVKRMWG